MPATVAPRAQVSPKKSAAGKSFTDEAEILEQTYFKSVGPRTYAAQLKVASNGNHFLVLTEGRRDAQTGEVRKTKMLVWSEDFVEFFNMLRQTAGFIKAHPVPDEIRQERERRWKRKGPEEAGRASGSPRGAQERRPGGQGGRSR